MNSDNLPPVQRATDSTFADIHAKFLGKYFYPELEKETGDKYVFETNVSEQINGVDWICTHKNGTVDYIDDKAKADNLSTQRHCDTLSSFAFEIDSVQSNSDSRVRRIGWFINEDVKTTIYNIHKVTARYSDKNKIAGTEDICASDCWMINKNDLLVALASSIGQYATKNALMNIADELRMSDAQNLNHRKVRILFFKDSETGTVYYGKLPKDGRRDIEIRGISIVFSAYNKNETPINLVLTTDFLESIDSTKRYHIDQNGVCEIPRSMSTLTSVGRVIKAVTEIKKLKDEIQRLKDSGSTVYVKHKDSGSGVTRVVNGIYDDVELESGYMISDKNIIEISGWLKMYYDLLDATCQKKGITDGEMFERKNKIKGFIDVFKQIGENKNGNE